MPQREDDDEQMDVVEALDRRLTNGSSRASSSFGFRPSVPSSSRSNRSSRANSNSNSNISNCNCNGTSLLGSAPGSIVGNMLASPSKTDALIAGIQTPSPPHHHHSHHHHHVMSTPSPASSLVLSAGGAGAGTLSPLRRELEMSRSSLSRDDNDNNRDAVRAGKRELARRLSLLAQRLTYGDSMDELVALDSQVNQIEQALGGTPSASPGSAIGSSGIGSPPPRKYQRPMSLETPIRNNRSSRSDLLDGGALFSSPASSLFRSRFSDLSPSLSRDHEQDESESEEEPPPKKGMTAQQSRKVIAEMALLNEEMANVVNNLKARQEESDHIHNLMVERTERAAQRILFLQNRISYLETELQDNDQELQHLRICLKAVEIQMPAHPDRELQRCISVFKEDYQALKRKRANRSTLVSMMNYDSTISTQSNTR